MLKLGIIGCGNIGRFVIRNLGRDEFKEFSLRIVADLPAVEATLKDIARSYNCDYITDPATLVDRGLNIVLEAANPATVKRYAV